MCSMFEGCKSLRNLDIRGWDVSGVWAMKAMFRDCESLETLDISNWKVSGVISMVGMFYGCKLLRIDTTMWEINTKNIEYMYRDAPNIVH